MPDSAEAHAACAGRAAFTDSVFIRTTFNGGGFANSRAGSWQHL